jgi:adenosylmethionine-8-amino-7-oxononanoate aminotransferase
LHDDGLLARVTPLGTSLEQRLRAGFSGHPNVGEIRGRGLLWALEIVADRATKHTFDPRLRVHARLKREAMKAGLVCYPMGGTVDGVRGDHVLIAPPFVAEEAQFDELVAKLSTALEATLDSAGREA